MEQVEEVRTVSQFTPGEEGKGYLSQRFTKRQREVSVLSESTVSVVKRIISVENDDTIGAVFVWLTDSGSGYLDCIICL